MQPRIVLGGVLLAAIAGGAFLLSRYKIEGLSQLHLDRRSSNEQTADSEVAAQTAHALPPMARDGDTIKIATFQLQGLTAKRLDNRQVLDVLARVFRRFDIVAVQAIRTRKRTTIPRLVEQINAQGRHYDFVLSPRPGFENPQGQYAYVFDAASVEVDRSSVYTVDDPDHLLRHDPLVAPFRVRGPAAEDAFTFTLVNMHVDPHASKAEINCLDDVLLAVRRDGRGEDDVILLGNLNADVEHLGELGLMPQITWANADSPTVTRGTEMPDNLLFFRTATIEFTGNSGVLDLMRRFDLTVQQALRVSDHLPVWAEFGIYEGEPFGKIATGPTGALPR